MLQKTQNPFGLDYNNILIETQRLYVRSLRLSDCAAWLQARNENYIYLQEREPIWDMDSLTYQGYYRLINDLMSSFTIGNYYSFGVFQKGTDAVVGGFEVSNIMYWPKQSASVGYWIGQNHVGQGFATETLVNMAHWASKRFNLVKIEAGTMLCNMASQKVLTKAGFTQEGISRSYGEINGAYEDHVLWGLVASELNKSYLHQA
jgi:ribosomal-protein-alanine N-acetyltransferase